MQQSLTPHPRFTMSIDSQRTIESFPTLKKRPWRRFVTAGDQIIGHKYPGRGSVDDPFVVDWLPDDPEDPMGWHQGYKWAVTMTVAVATLAVAMASSTL